MKKKNKKGVCTYKPDFYGWITVSEKGQIVIPADTRKKLDIKTGDKLLVLKRKDKKGLVLVKQDLLNKFLDKMRKV